MNSSQYFKCACPHCVQNIEYPEAMVGYEIDCPSCAQKLVLPAQSVEPLQKRGLFTSLIDKYRERKVQMVNEAAFRNELLLFAADGVLTEDELVSVNARLSELGLGSEFLRRHADELLSVAVKAVSQDGCCTPEGYKGVCLMALHFGTDLTQHPELQSSLIRALRRYQLRHDALQSITVTNVLLQNCETAYWAEFGDLYEEKVVSRKYEGGSRGASIRVAKGVSFRVGGHRGQLVTESASVPVSTGQLIVTNQRMIFAGDKKSFATSYKKIINLETKVNGLRFGEANRQKPRLVIFRQPNGDLVFEVLSRVLSGTD